MKGKNDMIRYLELIEDSIFWGEGCTQYIGVIHMIIKVIL